MQSSRCNCTHPLTRGRSRGCPVHSESENSISRLGKPNRQSTPTIEESEEEDDNEFEAVMDEILTQLAADRQATNDRFATLLADNRKVKLKEPKEFKGEDGYDINDFLTQFKKYCTFNGVKDDQKSVLFPVS